MSNQHHQQDNPGILLETIKLAMRGGALGVAVGRNIFQHQNPKYFLVHGSPISASDTKNQEYTGLQISQLVALKWQEHVDLERGIIRSSRRPC